MPADRARGGVRKDGEQLRVEARDADVLLIYLLLYVIYDVDSI